MYLWFCNNFLAWHRAGWQLSCNLFICWSTKSENIILKILLQLCTIDLHFYYFIYFILYMLGIVGPCLSTCTFNNPGICYNLYLGLLFFSYELLFCFTFTFFVPICFLKAMLFTALLTHCSIFNSSAAHFVIMTHPVIMCSLTYCSLFHCSPFWLISHSLLFSYLNSVV